MSLLNTVNQGINSVVAASNTVGISPSMNGFTALCCYLFLFVLVVYSLQLLIKSLLELSVELVVVTPARVSNALFKLSNKAYKSTVNSVKKAIQERKRVLAKGKAKAAEIRKFAEIAKAKEAAAKRAEATQAKSNDARCRTQAQPKKDSSPDLSVPAYIRAGIDLGKIFLDEKVSSSEPAISSATIKNRQEKRADFLKGKEISQKLKNIQTHRFTSTGLVEN